MKMSDIHTFIIIFQWYYMVSPDSLNLIAVLLLAAKVGKTSGFRVVWLPTISFLSFPPQRSLHSLVRILFIQLHYSNGRALFFLFQLLSLIQSYLFPALAIPISRLPVRSPALGEWSQNLLHKDINSRSQTGNEIYAQF